MFKPTSLEEEIVFSLFKVIRYTKKQANFQSHQDEPSQVQLQAMMAIEHGKTTMSDVADELNVAFPTASVIVDKLVNAGLVGREADKIDRRIIRLALSDEGKKKMKSFIKMKIERIKTLLDTLSTEDKQDLHRIIKNLETNLEKEQKNGRS